MLNVIASIWPNECNTEAVATAGEVPEAFIEKDGLHAKRADIDKLMIEYEAVAEVPRDVATNNTPTSTCVRTGNNGEIKYFVV